MKSRAVSAIDERRDPAETRLVTRNRDFATFAPFASEYPYETWIVPVKHPPSSPVVGKTLEHRPEGGRRPSPPAIVLGVRFQPGRATGPLAGGEQAIPMGT